MFLKLVNRHQLIVNRKLLITILFAIHYSLFTIHCFAQDGWRLYEQSFLTGYGWGKDSLNLPEGNYHPIFFNYRIGVTHPKLNITKKKKIDFEIFAEPQFNIVILSRKNGENSIYQEAGINIGYQPILHLNKFVSVYTYISAGPHYFNTPTIRQAKGFVFSDNMGAGCWFHLPKNFYINAMFKIRHLSNANTRYPNKGINTINALIGLGITY
ncbi:MAG: acyloxyacyl hydrolase [Bacteroidia bacterium]